MPRVRGQNLRSTTGTLSHQTLFPMLRATHVKHVCTSLFFLTREPAAAHETPRSWISGTFVSHQLARRLPVKSDKDQKGNTFRTIRKSPPRPEAK